VTRPSSRSTSACCRSRRAPLATGLLTAALAGVAPIISLIALLSLVVVGAQLSVAAAVIAVPALLLQLFCFILASRLAVAVYGVLLQVRSGAVIAALVNAFILAFTAQGWALIVAFVSTDVQGTMARAAADRTVRLGSGGRGGGRTQRLAASLLALAGLLVLGAVMLVAWSALLVRRTTGSRSGSKPRRLLNATNASDAAGAKERRSWTRDLLYGHQAVFAISYGLLLLHDALRSHSKRPTCCRGPDRRPS
jgi:ABC-2 type transport system permease protein